MGLARGSRAKRGEGEGDQESRRRIWVASDAFDRSGELDSKKGVEVEAGPESI